MRRRVEEEGEQWLFVKVNEKWTTRQYVSRSISLTLDQYWNSSSSCTDVRRVVLWAISQLRTVLNLGRRPRWKILTVIRDSVPVMGKLSVFRFEVSSIVINATSSGLVTSQRVWTSDGSSFMPSLPVQRIVLRTYDRGETTLKKKTQNIIVAWREDSQQWQQWGCVFSDLRGSYFLRNIDSPLLVSRNAHVCFSK